MSVGSVTAPIVLTLVFCRAQSGQRIPTGVVVMQSGQIGLPQFEHDNAGLAAAGGGSRPPSRLKIVGG